MTSHEQTQILEAYCRGELSRGHAMQILGIDWYGELLSLVHTAGLTVRRPGPDDLAIMDRSVAEVFGWVASVPRG